mgnify:CR=1 FL=1
MSRRLLRKIANKTSSLFSSLYKRSPKFQFSEIQKKIQKMKRNCLNGGRYIRRSGRDMCQCTYYYSGDMCQEMVD